MGSPGQPSGCWSRQCHNNPLWRALAESIAYFLRQLPEQEADASQASLAGLWIRVLQLAQILHDRLLHDMGIA
jgi:hypothetical protein